MAEQISTEKAEKKLALYVEKTVSNVAPEPQASLLGIPHPGRKLLAIRGYLRYPRLGRGSIEENWAWSAEEISDYKKSVNYEEAKAELEKVKTEFSRENPGYRLDAKTDVRTLEQQIKYWNQNETVLKAGQKLMTELLKQIMKSEYADTPDAAGLKRFKRYLASEFKLEKREQPTHATPGLSQHGQARAFDFMVYQGQKAITNIVAATAKKVWDEPGWTEKLHKAVTVATTKLKGPLKVPYEPWHYVYFD